MPDINPIYLKGSKGYRYLFLNRKQILKYSKDPNNDMSEKFVEEALRHKEECFAVLDGVKLASYSWFSSMPSHARGELYFYFDKSYKYRHKAYTYPQYRGQRLNTIFRAKACEKYTKRGFKGLLSVVEYHNLNSLRSNYRLGPKDIGNIYVLMVFGKYFSYADAGARKYGFKLKPFE